MRSDLVIQAFPPVPNRYLLVHATTLLTRKFHRRGQVRVAKTINDCLTGLAARWYVVDGLLICAGKPDRKPEPEMLASMTWGKAVQSVPLVECGQLVETA